MKPEKRWRVLLGFWVIRLGARITGLGRKPLTVEEATEAAHRVRARRQPLEDT